MSAVAVPDAAYACSADDAMAPSAGYASAQADEAYLHPIDITLGSTVTGKIDSYQERWYRLEIPENSKSDSFKLTFVGDYSSRRPSYCN